jgi:hypothetical protein
MSILNRNASWVVFASVLLASFTRLLPHPPGLTPIMAMAVLAGVGLPNFRWALAATWAAMLISDALTLALLNQAFATPAEYFLSWGILFIYIPLAFAAWVGTRLRNQNWMIQLLGTVGSGILFWVISNLGVWASSGMYLHTTAGLGSCFGMALPFLDKQILGDLLFSGVLLGGYHLTLKRPVSAHV